MLSRQELLQSAAVLLMLGFFPVGILLSMSRVGKVPLDSEHVAAAHLNALIGSLWMIAVALTTTKLRGKQTMYALVALSNYSNVFGTVAKSYFGVRGVDFDGNAVNNIFVVFLACTVVIPASVGCFLWIKELFKDGGDDDGVSKKNH